MQKPKRCSNASQPITLSHLPIEVHRLIFERLEVIEDVICLGLTSRHFWNIGEEYIHKPYESFLGGWAGHNIVCVGEHVEPDDYPPGLFSEEELDKPCKRTINTPFRDDLGEKEYAAEPFTLFHFASSRVSCLHQRSDLVAGTAKIYENCKERVGHVDPAMRLKRPKICVNENTPYPKDRSWILRNQTTKEYVRSEAIALKPEHIHGPHIDLLGFGEVVLSRFCWSSYPSISMRDPTDIFRGAWAGHCLDIVTLALHDAETDAEEWTDISARVAGEIGAIYESNYVSNWLEDLCRRRGFG